MSFAIQAVWSFYRKWGWLFGMILLALVFLLLAGFLTGCEVGRGDAGEIVIGVGVGRLVETFGQAAQVGLAMLPPPWGALGSIFLPLITGVGGAYATKLARDKADALYDEGMVRGTMEKLASVLAEKPQPIRGL